DENGDPKYPGIVNAYVYTVNQGVKQVHKGVELEVNYKPLRELTLTGFGSLGDWKYKGQARTTEYDENQNVIGTPSTPQNWDGLKVGDAAHTQFGLGLAYEFIKGISVDADYRYNGDLYSSRVSEKEGNLELPSYNVMDAGITWNYKLTNRNKLTLRFNVNNVFNHIYISEASTNIQQADGVDNYKGVNVNNQVYFGYGRTWNASVKITL
ncbi:MAG: TonB-dependent receptor, partial [Algoriella sp.]